MAFPFPVRFHTPEGHETLLFDPDGRHLATLGPFATEAERANAEIVARTAAERAAAKLAAICARWRRDDGITIPPTPGERG